MQELDHRIVAWFSGLDLPLVTPLMKLASAVGADGIVFVGIAFLGGAGAPADRSCRGGAGRRLRLPAAVDPDEGHRRPRPSQRDLRGRAPAGAAPDTSSMPNGHAWIAGAAATVLWVVIPARRVWIVGPAALIALSRVYLGVHYPATCSWAPPGESQPGCWCC